MATFVLNDCTATRLLQMGWIQIIVYLEQDNDLKLKSSEQDSENNKT